MTPAELNRFLGPTLSSFGLQLDDMQELIYGDYPAWAVYYRDKDCKLQVCWSERSGGINFMLAPLDAPNEFGLANRSEQWHYMLMLSDLHDDIRTPGIGAEDGEILHWLKALFDAHFVNARENLLRQR